MYIKWNDLTAEQQRAMLRLWKGETGNLSEETAEQLRNLQLAEMRARRIALSEIGRTLIPLAAQS